MRLLDTDSLDASPTVASSAMNRQRGLLGPNSYARDLHFDILAFLKMRLQARGAAAWLDLCCGTGRALIEAAERLAGHAPAGAVFIHGVDLVDHFQPGLHAKTVRLEAASLASWRADRTYDLITCIHGLHYIGDKLDLIRRAVSWLEPHGTFLAHLDAANLRLEGAPDARRIIRTLREAGVDYVARKHLLVCSGSRELDLPFLYLGADDQAGANYTGQAAVDSWYRAPL